MRKSIIVILTLSMELFLLLILSLHGQNFVFPTSQLADLKQKKVLIARLQLTDFAIWTEARYTRHPSQADFFSAFQNSPAAFDHFPAGSIIAPPSTP